MKALRKDIKSRYRLIDGHKSGMAKEIERKADTIVDKTKVTLLKHA